VCVCVYILGMHHAAQSRKSSNLTRALLWCVRRSERVSAEARPANVHALPDAGAGEGVPLQPLPDAAAADRDRARALSDGAPDQDLVPEPTHEAEEGTACRQGDQRAGASGTRRAGATQAAATAAARKGGQAARRATAPGHQDGHGQGSDGRRADQGRRQGVLSAFRERTAIVSTVVF
jgi:hypothetical protein